ncbi:hypothetical protein QAD02_020912 [Eretmocerus hayati]|uniref:Uncharacterized protein n=1 Tax=Eretmocerus hayati TaxID=131215 RepID=A0ACC2PNF5_9HYME|nr:hypothetical protein QAD02_020912 [Eretmocerus hayati]
MPQESDAAKSLLNEEDKTHVVDDDDDAISIEKDNESVSDISEVNTDDMSVAKLWEVMQKFISAKLKQQSVEINENTDSKVDVLIEKVDTLYGKVAMLEDDMQDAFNRLSVLENSEQNTQGQAELVIAETNERMIRAKNVILLGVSETVKDQQIPQFLQNLLRSAPFELNNIHYARLGKAQADKCRPLKVYGVGEWKQGST